MIFPDRTMLLTRATGFSRFEDDKFPVVFWKNPENSCCKIPTPAVCVSQLFRVPGRATGFSRFEDDKFPVVFWKNPENPVVKLMTYLHANTFIIRAHSYRGSRNFEPNRGIWVLTAEFDRGINRGIRLLPWKPRHLTFLIRTTFFSQKMTSK